MRRGARDAYLAYRRRLDSTNPDDHRINPAEKRLAVFLLHLKELAEAKWTELEWEVLRFDPFYTHNENMIAQQGTFTLVKRKARDNNCDMPHLKQVIESSNHPQHWLRKLTLPWAEASRLRALLYKLGIYAGSVMPGPDGAREDAAGEARDQRALFKAR
ncbi:MAG: hypothetical protein IPL79_13765 [Myxococcales bacterium]|nr:hypothetical protein [Myxococcales bacterium]